MNKLKRYPDKDYYAVIFTSQRSKDNQGYDEISDRMVKLAAQQPGFIDIESVRDTTGAGITISYWKDKKSIDSWKENIEHLNAQKAGKEKWYLSYKVRISKIERSYAFK